MRTTPILVLFSESGGPPLSLHRSYLSFGGISLGGAICLFLNSNFSARGFFLGDSVFFRPDVVCSPLTSVFGVWLKDFIVCAELHILVLLPHWRFIWLLNGFLSLNLPVLLNPPLILLIAFLVPTASLSLLKVLLILSMRELAVDFMVPFSNISSA